MSELNLAKVMNYVKDNVKDDTKDDEKVDEKVDEKNAMKDDEKVDVKDDVRDNVTINVQVDTLDPLFIPDSRVASLPIYYPTILQLLKKQRGCYWQTHEVPLYSDLDDWNNKLNKDERFFLKMILAFFASSDLIVNENLATRFINDIKPIEIQMLYRYQAMMEDIHSEMYALLIDTYISDPVEKKHLLNAVVEIPIIKKKAEWAEKWISSDLPYNQRLLAFAAIEGIFFSGAFCSIFWMKERGMLKGLTLSNDFISRDEGLHVSTAEEIHKLLRVKASEDVAHAIIKDAVDLEIKFICEALPCKLIGINSKNMTEYIKYVANRLLKQFNYNIVYENIKQPFAFMDRIALDSKSNFFELRPSQYNKLETSVDVDPYGDIKSMK